jgi:uncharacterized DUF497 family protein
VTIEEVLAKCTGFEWDDHNVGKIWSVHRVAFWECEEVFFNEPLVVANDVKHSSAERRFYALGQANGGRLLFLVFTVRDNLIRVISARDMTPKEKKVYQSYEE